MILNWTQLNLQRTNNNGKNKDSNFLIYFNSLKKLFYCINKSSYIKKLTYLFFVRLRRILKNRRKKKLGNRESNT